MSPPPLPPDVLIVRLGGQRLGFLLGDVLEVCLPLPTAPLPLGAPPAVRGVALHRERAVTVVGDGGLLVVLREPLAVAVEGVEGVRRGRQGAPSPVSLREVSLREASLPEPSVPEVDLRRRSLAAPSAVMDAASLLRFFGLAP